MSKIRFTNAVRLEFSSDTESHSNLSGAAFSDQWLWIVGDETSQVDRLRHLDSPGSKTLQFGQARHFALADVLDLPGAADEEADVEGLAVDNDFLWLVGSHGLKRKAVKADRDGAESSARLAKVTLDGNRCLLACVPIEHTSDGQPELTAKARDGRRALRLHGNSKSNQLTDALAKDMHFGPFMAIPGKENGFDIEGLAVNGQRLLLGLRGPVLRGWSALLEIEVEAHRDGLRLVPLDQHGSLLRKHFLPLEGLGVRDLHFFDDDLFILAGPTMALDGEIRIYRWADAKVLLATRRGAAHFDAVLSEVTVLPHGRGVNRAEALCNVPRSVLGAQAPSWLVLYDAPGPDRIEGESVVFGDLVRHS